MQSRPCSDRPIEIKGTQEMSSSNVRVCTRASEQPEMSLSSCMHAACMHARCNQPACLRFLLLASCYSTIVWSSDVRSTQSHVSLQFISCGTRLERSFSARGIKYNVQLHTLAICQIAWAGTERQPKSQALAPDSTPAQRNRQGGRLARWHHTVPPSHNSAPHARSTHPN